MTTHEMTQRQLKLRATYASKNVLANIDYIRQNVAMDRVWEDPEADRRVYAEARRAAHYARLWQARKASGGTRPMIEEEE